MAAKASNISGFDEIIGSFHLLGRLAHGIMMEQLSKTGSSVQFLMREGMEAYTTKQRTRVDANGNPYLSTSTPRTYGARESHTMDGRDSNPANMSSFINSALFEKSNTLVVGGAHPTMTPLTREDGVVTGTEDKLYGVGTRTMSIIDRMNSGQERGDYPERSQLTQEIDPMRFMDYAVNKGKIIAKRYLEDGYVQAYGQAINKAHFKRKIIGFN